MRKSGHYSQHNILEQLNKWMDWLETPNEDFGGFPVCPFFAPERKTNKLLIEFYDYGKESIFEKIKKFDSNDGYDTALFLHTSGGEHLTRKEYESFISEELKNIDMGHLKAVCFSPYEKIQKNGVKTREHAPCFITSITTRKALGNAWSKMKDTHYWKKDK